MAITTDDFNKIWASTSPLTPYEFSESQYKEGWNFIGGTPPSRQMWDFLQKNNDEKSQYLLNNFDNYLPLSGGTVSGDLSVSGAIYSSDPASGENGGQVPTTAWVQKLVAEALKTAKNEIYKQAKLDAHPVGSYYWSNDSTSPATLFGGTWEALPAGYTLIAQGSGNDDFGSYTYTAGHKYGERKHQLTTDEMPAHKHEQGDWMWAVSDNFNTGTYSIPKVSSGNAVTYLEGKASQKVWTTSSGGNSTHNNVQPSICAYCWKRTA